MDNIYHLTIHTHRIPGLNCPGYSTESCEHGYDSVISGFYRIDQEPGSSVSIVSDYGLDDRAIGVRSQAGAKDFSSNLCVQTGSGAHPASCTMGTGGPFPGGKSAAGA
jgi:hypothetical protein